MKLIDADKLNIYDVSPAYGTCVMGVTEEDIELAPTVDAVPVRHGKWELVSEDWRHQIEWWECSECNFSASTKYNYCPHCGAKMGEQEKQNDSFDKCG